MSNISIVVPVYNEEENVAELHKEIKEVCEKNNYNYEIIFIDDGSTDKTFKEITKLHPIRCIRLRKNFGQTAAMDAGIKSAKNEYIITMDGDRQNDPNDIPKLIKYLEKKELDIVSGWRKNRKDPFLKFFISRGANFLRKIIVNDKIHDSGCSLKIYRKECFKGVSLYGEMHRFIPALLKIRGFQVGEIVVNHRPRVAGKTKYNWKRTIKGLTDMVAVWFWNKFAVRPLHLLGGLGILILFAGCISSLVTVILFIQGSELSETVFPLLSAFLVITGLHIFISGLLADMLSKSYYDSKGISSYSIKDTVENESTDNE